MAGRDGIKTGRGTWDASVTCPGPLGVSSAMTLTRMKAAIMPATVTMMVAAKHRMICLAGTCGRKAVFAVLENSGTKAAEAPFGRQLLERFASV